MKKVLIIANNDMGLYKFRRDLIEAFVEKYEVFISVPKGEYSSELTALGCKLIFSDLDRRSKNIFKEIGLFFYYKKIIKQISPDIVFTYTIKPNIYGGLCCSRLKVPYAANITGVGTAIKKGNLLSKALLYLYRLSLKKAKLVFFQNNDNLTFFKSKKIVDTNYVLLPGSGVNLSDNPYEKYPEKQDDVVLLFVGRIMKDKGIYELVSAAKALKEEYKNLKFKVIGPLENDYANEFKAMEANKYVEICGVQKDVHRFMKEAHAIVMPTYHEGMCNVCLEGAACGRPLIASNVPGCKETFEEGVTGIGFEARDTDALICAIKKFLDIPYEQKVDMGKRGRLKMENEFDRKIVVKEYLDFLQTFVDER